MPRAVRRPARPRTPGANKKGGASAAPTPANLFEPSAAPTPHEIACPNCGEPMLSGWGTTCGRCHPNLVMPKTLFLAPGQMVASPSRAEEGLSLGWLVVVGTLDSQRQGSLIELNHASSILSRTDASLSGRPGLFEF